MNLIEAIHSEAHAYAYKYEYKDNYSELKMNKVIELVMNEVEKLLPYECYSDLKEFKGIHVMHILKQKFNLGLDNKPL